ncbi:hypothetical protein [Hoeflea sp.]|uniref:hypothetical protein n=1 Tax=Hoeflea sp. TaxID=1940281 RepID=UPI003A94711C
MTPHMDKLSNQRLSRLDKVLLDIPRSTDVTAWRIDGLDLWPLFVTVIAGLALHIDIGYRRGRIRVGSKAWQAAIHADYRVRPSLARLFKRRHAASPRIITNQLPDAILLVGTRHHGRGIGDYHVIPPLDVPSLALRAAGQDTVQWLIDAGSDDPVLARLVQQPTSGIAAIMNDIQAKALNGPQSLGQLNDMPGMRQSLVEIGVLLQLKPAFLMMWFARQVDLMLSAFRSFGEVFDQQGHPKTLVIVAGGYWWSAGLSAAARARGTAVVEIEHGAERPCALTAQGQLHHFSRFNTAPEALVSWSVQDRGDPRFLALGPVGNLLPALARAHPATAPGHRTALDQTICNQEAALAKRAGSLQREVLISSDDANADAWIADLVRRLPDDTFCWIRRHPAERDRPLRGADGLDPSGYDIELASGVLLPLILSRVDAHFTRFSAVTLEAAAMGVPTLATQPYAAALFGAHVPPELFKLMDAETDIPGELARLPHRQTGDRRQPDHAPDELVAFIQSLAAKNVPSKA